MTFADLYQLVVTNIVPIIRIGFALINTLSAINDLQQAYNPANGPFRGLYYDMAIIDMIAAASGFSGFSGLSGGAAALVPGGKVVILILGQAIAMEMVLEGNLAVANTIMYMAKKAGSPGGSGSSGGTTDQLRNTQGTATGSGQDVSGKWIQNGKYGEFPKEIADKLRGKVFSNFREFREMFWEKVADSQLAKQFSPQNIRRMQKGLAPFAPVVEQNGENKVFQLHHIEALKDGGAVYDMDNLLIVSPKYHIGL